MSMEQRAGYILPDPEAERLFQAALTALLDGDGKAGYQKLVAAIRNDPSHYMAVLLFAAMSAHEGRDAAAREIMQTYYARYPVRSNFPPGAEKAPALLIVRGFSGTRLIAARLEENGIKAKFRGGHFTTRHLLRAGKYPVHRLTIAGDTILKPGVVPDHGLLLNTIADPDVEAETLATLARYLEGRPDARVINRPERVLKLSRDRNHQRFDRLDGVRFPQTHRLQFDDADAGTVAAELSRLGLDGATVILRPTQGQTARHAALVENREDLDKAVGDGLTGEYYAIRYVQSLWQGRMFRKLRLFCIDGRFYPVVCHLDHFWNVHGDNRRKVMKSDPELMDEEQRFLRDWQAYVGAENVARLERIAGMVGLDWFGLDFTVDEDGDLLIYELNPAMRHSHVYGVDFPYKVPVDQAITDAFTAMVEGRLRAV